MKITGCEALCNLGDNIESIYQKAICGDNTRFDYLDGIIKDNNIRVGLIKTELPNINDNDYNIRCNRLIAKVLALLQDKIVNLKAKYAPDKIGVIVATTNSGVEEYEKSRKQKHSELSNPAFFIKDKLNLKGFCATVSTACSSGIKAFILAKDLLNNGVVDSVIIAAVDSFAKVPVYGFNSLEVLSDKPNIPFSKNRSGMNIGEAVTVFTVENNESENKGIEVMGMAESSDIYHPTTPDPNAVQAIKAINMALNDAGITFDKIDYINAHGTGTFVNDIMEAKAINRVFSSTPVSSTKPLTGHCLGAGAGIEIALCLKLITNFDGRLYPNMGDGHYDSDLAKIKLVKKDEKFKKCDICMCNSFGFGGTNAIMILGSRK